MDEALAIERITENENLTDGLNDEDARWLLQWGTGHAGELIAGATDDEAAGQKINQLMAVMRSLNAIAADRTVKDSASLAADIRTLRDRYAITFGNVATHSEDEIARLGRALPAMSAREAMRQLLAFLEPPAIAATMGPSPAAQPTEPEARETNETNGHQGKSPLTSFRRRIAAFFQNRKRIPLLLGVLSIITLIVVLIAVAAGMLRRQPTQPGQITTPTSAIAVYFTGPSGQVSNGVDQRVVADLDRARKTVDLASFDFNLPSVTNALVRAQSRGVTVRVVLDEENGTQTLRASDAPDKQQFDALPTLSAAHIPVADGGRSTGLMHNKFILIDGAILYTGSWNMSFNDTFRNNNNLLRITNHELVANYQAKFNEMFVDHRFGAKSTVGASTPRLTMDGITVENYFSPHDHIMSKLVALVDGAKSSVHFLAFTFTSPDLADAMIARDKAGVGVRGVIENRGALQGVLPDLFCKGIAVRTDGNQYTMHDKVIILDGQTVITGSFNFTQSADRYNDENVIILHDPALAALYEQEFGRIVAAAKQPSNVRCAA